MSSRSTSAVLTLAILAGACGGAIAIRPPEHPPSPAEMKELWVDPGDTPRDLFWGVGGERYAPKPDAVYKFVERDDVGFSASYTVTDPDGVEWSAKIGPEAQTEVLLSRILWGLGYHRSAVPAQAAAARTAQGVLVVAAESVRRHP
jgi:hypothetical protein